MSFLEFAAVRVIRLYPLILVGTLLGFAVFVAGSVTSQHQSPFTSNSVIALICEIFLVPIPVTVGQGYAGYMPFDIPAWSLFFELIANFIYAAFVRSLTDNVLVGSLVFGAMILLAQSYVPGGVSETFFWGGFARVFFPFLCGVLIFRRWDARPRIGRAKLAPVMAIALLVAFLCPVPLSANWLYESLMVLVVFPIIIIAGARDAPGPRATSFYLFLGRLSYPLYILHYPLIRVFSRFPKP